MYEIFEQLLQKYGISAYKVAKEAGVTQTALSNWKNGRNTPSVPTLQKIAEYFGVTVDYLMTGKEETEKEPKLKPKDEKDIKEILANTEQLLKQDGLMFDGDPASPEAIESILSAMQIGMEMARKRTRRNTLEKSIKRIDVMNIKTAVVDSLVRKYKSRNPFEIIEASQCNSCLLSGMSWVTCSCTRKRMQSSWTLGRNSILLSTK